MFCPHSHKHRIAPTHSHTGLLPPYSIVQGAQCASGYSPLTSSWQDCKAAAVSLGLKGDSVAHVAYNHPWGTTRPQGCFRAGDGKRVHFNRGKGGHAKAGDSMICRRTGKLFAEAGQCEPEVMPAQINTFSDKERETHIH